MTNRPAGIFVLGMHRSGTSASILSLESLGLNLCLDSDRLREGLGQSNPDHGESLTVIAENDALLDLYAGTWLQPRLDPEWLSSELVTRRSAASKSAFTSVHPDTPWACKDPRLCLTLPYWEQALGGRFPVLLVIRHPLEIVKSLQKREEPDSPHHPSSYYLALWERYLRSALTNAARHPVYVLNYADLLNDWDATTTDLGKWLARHGLPVTEPARRPIDPKLRHARAGASLAGLTPDQRRLHQLSLSLVGPHHRLRAFKLGRETPRTEALFGPGPDSTSAGFLALPAAKNLRRRLAQINPLESRRYAAVGAAATVLLGAAAATLMQLSRLNGPTAIDTWFTNYLAQPQIPVFDSLLRLLSTISARPYLDAIALVATAVLLVWRKRSAAVVMALALLTSDLVTTLLRTQSRDPAGFFGGQAFRAAVILGLIGYLSLRLVELAWARRAVATISFTLIILVALSLVYIQAHYPSAILASLLLGCATAALFIASFEAVQKSPHRVAPKRRHIPAKLAPTIPLDDIS